VKALRLGFFLFLGLLSSIAWAKEGSDQYPNGAENWFAGFLPPAGNYYINYFGYYGGELKNGEGQKVLMNGKTPSVNATFDALRYVRVTPLRVLGANYGMEVIMPVVYQSVDMNGTASKTSIGDLIVNPMIFGWHRPTWHAIGSMDVMLPTGFYDKNDARVSVGANYYGFDPLFSVSVMPKSGWETSIKLMYDLKTTNQATNYHSGQEFHTDFAVGKHLGGWMLGATGYALVQTTNDTVNGVTAPGVPGLWDSGRRGQVVSIGPSVGYNNSRHVMFAADWQHETEVRNRFGGDKFWFKMIVPLPGFGGISR
jgi:hypothetical protein